MSKARGSESPFGFDWRSPGRLREGKTWGPAQMDYNHKLLVMLHEGWGLVLEDPKHWDKFDKTDVQAAADERAAAKAKEADDEFGDLDLDEIDID